MPKRIRNPNPQKRPPKTTKYRGVYLDKKGGKYASKFRLHPNTSRSRIKHLGMFEDPKEAAIAFDWANLKYNHCATSVLNFPDMVHNLDVEPKRKKNKLNARNTSGYKGVRQVPGGKFVAKIGYNNTSKQMGTFETAIAAAIAYDKAAIKKGNRPSK